MKYADLSGFSTDGQTQRRPGAVQQVRATRRRGEGRNAIRAVLEMCEPRMLLAATLRSKIGATVAPAAVAQTLLAPGVNSYSLTSSSTATAAQSNFRFSVNNASPDQLTTFTTRFSSGASTSDAAIAIYDNSGNRVFLQDADNPALNNETLQVNLQSGVVYTAEFFGLQTAASSTVLSLQINTGSQKMGAPLTLDPVAHAATVTVPTGAEGFDSSGAVRYIPLDLLNTSSGSLTFTPPSPDTAIRASVYLQASASNNSWSVWASQTLPAGQASALALITPPTSGSATDGTYVLALAPLDFTASPQPVTIAASFAGVAPSTVAPASAVGPLTETLTPAGLLGGLVSNTTTSGGNKVYSFIAPISGPVALSASAGYPKYLAVYGPGGSTVIDVVTTTISSAGIATTFDAVAGTQYFFAVGGVGTSSGSFSLTATQTLTNLAAIAVTSTLGQQSLLQIAPASGGKVFQLTTPVGTDFLAVQLAPDSGSTLTASISIVGSDGIVQSVTAASAGIPATIVLDQSSNAGPYTVFINSPTGAGTASLKYAALDTPNAPTINQYPTSLLNFSSGGISGASLPVTTGTPIGMQYFQPANASNAANTLFTATATTSGAASILLHYVQDGSGFRLVESSLPNSQSNSPNLFVPVRGQTLHALVALPINFSGGGQIQLTVGGPKPVGVGLATVPNTSPGQSVPPQGFQAIANLQNGKLSSSVQRDLYSVQVPLNANATTTTLTYTPNQANGPLAVTVNVLNANNVQIATQTSTPGGSLSIPITGLVAGQPIRFEIKSVGTNLGDGAYKLSVPFNTTNPLPFLVTQQFFYPGTNSPVAGRNYLPIGFTDATFPTIPVNGSVQGNFTSSSGYDPSGSGSIKVFKINNWANNAPFTVTTTDVDPGVNVNFALFYLSTDGSGNTAYKRLNGSAPSFDYLPGDRTSVDAKIVVNNTDLDPVYSGAEIGGGPITVYAVVMNEQGTQGRFNIAVTQPNVVATTGPGNLTGFPVLPVAASANSQFLADQQKVQEATNGTTFTLRTPSDMTVGGTPTLSVKTNDFSTGQTISVSVGRGIVAVGNYSGVVGAGGVVNISLTGGLQAISRNNTYQVTITASSFPSNGLTLGFSVPRTASGIVPPALAPNVPQQLTFNSTYNRLNPLPNGTLNQLFAAPSGVLSTMFTVEVPGTVTLNVAYPAGSTSVSVGLYQSGLSFTNSNGPFTPIGALLDYSNVANGSGLYAITATLARGTYFLRGTGTIPSGTFTIATVTGSLPIRQARVLEVEPGTGITSASEETIINQGTGPATVNSQPFSVTHNNSSMFAVTVPSNTNGQPISFSLYDTADNVSTGAGIGIASVFMWRLEGGVYTQVASSLSALSASTHSRTLTSSDVPVAGAQYFIGVNLNTWSIPLYVGVNIPVFSTGTADFSVQPVTLTANAGSTLIGSGIANNSFTASPAANYALQLGTVTSTRAIPPLAPFGALTISQSWQPGAASDVVTITANPTSAVPELSRTNNSASKALSTVDPAAPTATISLLDPLMTAEGNAGTTTGGGTWGRYIAGVPGQATTIRVSGADTDSNLYQIVAKIQNGNGTFALDNLKVFYTNGTSSFTSNIPFDFGSLGGTTSTNLNQLKFYAIDSFGLKTPTYIQTLDVATRPTFLTGGIPLPNVMGAGGTVTFNAATHQFKYDFQDSIISVSKTLSDLLGISLPVVGDKKNEFLVSITGTGTSGLSPIGIIPLSLSGHAKLTALDQNIFDKTVNGTQTSGSITFKTEMALNGRSLVPSSTSVSLQVANLQLYDYKSPLIPIYSLGIPGIAEVKAGIKFGLNAKLNAGAKIGFDPLAGGVGGYLGSLGVMSPTFIQPIITGSATVAGDISVLGFDIAELSGTVALTLTITLGLDNNVPGEIISFADAATDLALSVGVSINVHLAAHVAIIGDIYTYDYNHDFGNIVNTIDEGIFLTDPPSFASGKFIGPPARRRANGDEEGPPPVIKNGSSLVGAYTIDPSPQLVINNSTLNGMGLSMQLINAGTAAAPLANLAFTNRVGGVWSALTTLSGANDVADPVLALTHDGAGTPGVVVYNVDNIAGSPATQTLNQRLNSQEIRYRYFNGTTWGVETSLTSDSLYDSQQSTAFNAGGEGVVAYVHNNNATPINGAGSLDSASNDIYAAIWNPFTHSFGAPLVITSAAGNDSSPAAYVDASGKRTVVWIHSEAGVSQLMYSTNTGSGWSPQAPLAISGLVAGGKFTNVSLGSDGANRLDVIFSYVSDNADGSISTTLYHRPATVAGFAGTLPAVQLAANSTFSGLKTTSAPSGALVAYWQQSDGETNQIFETTITSGVATTPVQISTSQNLAKRPSAAVDGDGKIQLVYANTTVYGGTTQGSSGDPTVGAPLTGAVGASSISSLPQLTFTQGLAFPIESQASAPIGSTINGTAVIANRGLASANVTVTAYRGIPGAGGVVVGTPFTITLAPGASYNVSQPFVVVAGNQTYSLQVTTPSAQAFNSTTENISSATLKGLVDLTISLINDVSSPSPGSTQSLQASVFNASSASTGAFTVTLYAGDPLSPQSPLTVIGTQTVSNLIPLQSILLTFPVTLPGVAGDYIYTARADSAEVIEESNENNNIGRYEVHFRADPAIVLAADGSGPVTATLLNSGTSNNVQVTVNVANLGATNMINVPVNLRVSRNGGAFVSLGQQIIASLPVGALTSVTFTVTSLGGENEYVASFDNSILPQDVNLGNNVGTASLIVPGLASLIATASLSSGTSVAGSPLTLTANLTNAGLADAQNVPLVVVAQLTSGGPTYTIGTGSISLAGLASGSTQIALDTSLLPRGVYTFTLQVDPAEAILQDAATNNISLSAIIQTPLVLTAAAEYLRLDNDGQRVNIWHNSTGTGTPDLQVVLSTISTLTSSNSAGGQVIHVDFGNGNPLPATGLAFNGNAAGNNRLDIIGGGAPDNFTFNPGSVVFSNEDTTTPVTITRSNVGTVTLTGVSDRDVVNVTPNSLPTNLQLYGDEWSINGLQNLNGTTLDVGRSNAVFINYTPGNDPVTAIRQSLIRGFNGGAWNGTASPTQGAITSVFAASGTLTGVGYADSADGRGINTTPNTIVLKYTLRADATLDGNVNFSDLVLLAQNYNVTPAVWDQGDFNYDGKVDFSDLVILAQEYNLTLGSSLVESKPGKGINKRPPTIDQLLGSLPVMAQLPRKAPKDFIGLDG